MIYGSLRVASTLHRHFPASTRYKRDYTQLRDTKINLDEYINVLNEIESTTEPKKRRKLSSLAQQRDIFDKIGANNKISKMEDWYSIKVKDIQKDGAGSIILDKYYRNSLVAALNAIYPEHSWNNHLFSSVPQGFWGENQNARSFVESIATSKGWKNREDWYNLSKSNVLDAGGAGLLDTVSGSVYKLLTKAFPEYEWLPWRFRRPPNRLWSNASTQQAFLSYVANQLGFHYTDTKAWLERVKPEDIIRNGGGGLLQRQYNGSLQALLLNVYPNLDWPVEMRIRK